MISNSISCCNDMISLSDIISFTNEFNILGITFVLLLINILEYNFLKLLLPLKTFFTKLVSIWFFCSLVKKG